MDEKNNQKLHLKITKIDGEENKGVIQKISENNEKKPEKRSVFKITAIILILLLVIGIFIEIFVMVWLKNSSESLKNKNDNLPTESLVFTLEEN